MPNVNVDEFSSLLTFMYTGYLDLNISNIYNVLLATHILHMPRALEICRTFLLQSHPLETRTSIIKPIPSRKSALPYPQIFAPTFCDLQKSEQTPFKAIVNEKHAEKPSTSKMVDAPGHTETVAKKACVEKAPKLFKRRAENATKEKTIVDIACCDGPVRFHRVINKNYGLPGAENDYTFEEVNRNEVMNKVMNESIRDKQMSDENNVQSSSDLFTCLYCNHTFKSQYCYQKHARRHLNPISLDVKTGQTDAGSNGKREVKLLDMNVQYYPCKTCGSKFPSYYFVHKHRKLCHAEEMADNNNKNNEITPESNQETVQSDDSSKHSAIDVEAVNQ